MSAFPKSSVLVVGAGPHPCLNSIVTGEEGSTIYFYLTTFLIASINVVAENGLYKNATPPMAKAWRSISVWWWPVIKMMGNLKPSAANWRANSTPVMSPRWISTMRQNARHVEARAINVSAESKVSTSYPCADKSASRDPRISGSSSTTAMIFCGFDINLIQKKWLMWCVSGLQGRSRPAAAGRVQSCTAPRAQ